MDVRKHNRSAWDKQVELGNLWTIPVSSECIAAARKGQWEILLTPTKPVPKSWFSLPLKEKSILCLASGGGQQGPILAATRAKVTVFDNSPVQLAQDRQVAKREKLSLKTVEGDMRDLSIFPDASFDLIIHPVSNVFIPHVQPVWEEAYRVLRGGGSLLSGFDNPAVHIFDDAAYVRGELQVTHALPHLETETLSEEEIAKRKKEGAPLEFGHTLEDLISGQIKAGFIIIGLYEDRCPPQDKDLLGQYMDTFIATRAGKN